MSDRAHSPLGASSAERWLNCPASYTLSKDAPDVPSKEAMLGTAAHDLAARCVLRADEGKAFAWEHIGQQFNGFDVGFGPDEVDPNAVQEYVDFVVPILRDALEYGIEARIGGTEGADPDFHGTADFYALLPGRLVIVDFKYGQGISVGAFGNKQLLYYAFGVLDLPEIRSRSVPDDFPVTLVIVQPRRPVNDPVDAWITDAGTIRAWARDVLFPGMERARNETDNFVLGEHCRFCPAKLACPEMRTSFVLFSEAGTDMDDEKLDWFYARVPNVRMFINALEAKVYARLQEGADFRNAKLVAKRTTRVWKEGAEERLGALMGEDAYAKTLKTPSQIEKLGGNFRSFVAQWAYVPEAAGSRVAHVDDPAPAIGRHDDLEKMSQSYLAHDNLQPG